MYLKGKYTVPSGLVLSGEVLEEAVAIPSSELAVSSKDSSLVYDIFEDGTKSKFILDFVSSIDTPVEHKNGSRLSESDEKGILKALMEEAKRSMCPDMEVIDGDL